MLLTVLIPTRNRASLLARCLDSVVRSIDQAAMQGKVEIVVVDNFSRDATQEVVARHADRGDVFYQKHKTPAATAEESLCQAIPFANGEYVWSLGDDDVLVENAIERVMGLISTSSFDFMLLNRYSKVGDRLYNYFRTPYPTVTYEQGIDLFRDLGIISATTTISCLCFRKAVLSQVDWLGLMKISSIYSHSGAFLVAFHDRPCAFLEDPCIITQKTREEETGRITGTATSSGRPAMYPFTIGLIGLIKEVARRLQMPVAEIGQFEEIELSKTSFTVFNTTTAAFIARMVIRQLVLTIQRQDTSFSVDDIAAILQFFSEAGDSWCQTTLRYAIATAHAADKPADERLAILNGYLQSFCDAKQDTLSSAVVMPESWRKSYFLYSHGVPFKVGRGIPGDALGRAMVCAGENGVRLTILIPAYNRAKSLAEQLRGLHLLGVHDIPEIEVFVADNRSTDRTPQVCRAAAKLLPNLRPVRYETHLPTAEENINRAIGEAKGDYVWLLGDDEIVRPVFYLLLNLVWHGQSPCYVFNNLISPESEQEHGCKLIERIHGRSLIGLSDPLTCCSLESLVKRFGLTTAMAFISRYVLRRSAIKPFDHYLRVSPIYAHVFGLLESLAGQQVTFVNYALVHRRASPEEGFKRLGVRRSRPYYFPWTTGLVRLAKAAATRGVVERQFLASVQEVTFENSYELQTEMKIQFVRQLIHYCESWEKAQLPLAADFEEFFDYFRNDADPDWTGCCLFLSYLKLEQIESRRGAADDRSSCPIAELTAIQNNLRKAIDDLVTRVPLTVLPKAEAFEVARLKRMAKRLLGTRASRLLGRVYRSVAARTGGLLPSL